MPTRTTKKGKKIHYPYTKKGEAAYRKAIKKRGKGK